MQRLFKKFRRRETGAAAAETAITIMTFLIVILGIIQLTLMINARLLVNYAAYCAVRAGIVHNGDQHRMEQAAAVALTPLFSASSNLGNLGVGYSKAQLLLALGLLKVEKLSPNGNPAQRFFPEFTRYGDTPQGSDAAKLNANLLTVKVTFYFALEIPLVNTMLSPFWRRVAISSIHRMRMQSDHLLH